MPTASASARVLARLGMRSTTQPALTGVGTGSRAGMKPSARQHQLPPSACVLQMVHARLRLQQRRPAQLLYPTWSATGSHVVRRHQHALRGRQAHQERWRQATTLQLVGACRPCQPSRWNRGTGMLEGPVSGGAQLAARCSPDHGHSREPRGNGYLGNRLTRQEREQAELERDPATGLTKRSARRVRRRRARWHGYWQRA